MCTSNFVTALQQLSPQTVSCYYYFHYVISKFRTSTVWRYGPFNVIARLALWLTRQYFCLRSQRHLVHIGGRFFRALSEKVLPILKPKMKRRAAPFFL